MDAGQEDSARWLEEGRELIGRLRRAIEHLVQENERLLGRLDEFEATMARINQDNNRLRAERDELLAAFNRIAHLVEQVRLSRGGTVG
ncbi:MAG: hypothetical protein ACREJY_06220 [Candidatus Rokuibacteriota bacterium]